MICLYAVSRRWGAVLMAVLCVVLAGCARAAQTPPVSAPTVPESAPAGTPAAPPSQPLSAGQAAPAFPAAQPVDLVPKRADALALFDMSLFMVDMEQGVIGPFEPARSDVMRFRYSHDGKKVVLLIMSAGHTTWYVARPPGKIHTWLSADVVVTTDCSSVYTTNLTTGDRQSRSLQDLFSGKLAGNCDLAVNPAEGTVIVSAVVGSYEYVVLEGPGLRPVSGRKYGRPEGAWGVPGNRGVPLVIVDSKTGVELASATEGFAPFGFVYVPEDAGVIQPVISNPQGFQLSYTNRSGTKTDLQGKIGRQGLTHWEWNPTWKAPAR